MSLKNQILAQAKLLSGELNAQQTALLEVLCGLASDSLKVRLKENTKPEDCAGEFIAAACLYALADFKDMEASALVEEFKAGDLTVKKGSHSHVASRNLRMQADQVIAPYLADGFCFAGV